MLVAITTTTRPTDVWASSCMLSSCAAMICWTPATGQCTVGECQCAGAYTAPSGRQRHVTAAGVVPCGSIPRTGPPLGAARAAAQPSCGELIRDDLDGQRR